MEKDAIKRLMVGDNLMGEVGILTPMIRKKIKCRPEKSRGPKQ